MATTTGRLSARERLLAAADELFYNEGVHTVGIDRVIEQAGVAKASLYNTFGSKDELIHAYLKARQDRIAERIMVAVDAAETPREKLLAVFDGQIAVYAESGYQGCAFHRASAESRPGDRIDLATRDYRAWVRALFTELAEQAGVADPTLLATQLQMVFDGNGTASRNDRSPASTPIARAAAETLLDAALA
ncbi:TetR/AcrR family transcriptional regulator [Kutzneria kofuensis]|uniref:AcrR family transcriptional regulator n=1 Tax=Kutzneria kofuensis TaxID=103725 RepID=A0A7W9KR88_9PSEU|nr:TetR/AcrR family transcriptional regulator [Kutzneria kofuensis]MBB5897253.1 AcrR family transcriptional regulator [Kutzneria kofuensis]